MDKVLIVDDDAQLLLILTEALTKYRSVFEIFTVEDGLAAIKALQKEHFSLVVTDIQMPRVNGLVLLSYMVKNFPVIPCIVMTAHGTPDLKKRMEQESLHYIEKPFKVPQLVEAIMSILGQPKNLGGTLNGVSVNGFLRLIEMESITCLCEINSKDRKKGYLFFNKGILFNALCGNLKGEEAALELLKMDGCTIKFRNPPQKEIKRQIVRKLSDLLADTTGSSAG